MKIAAGDSVVIISGKDKGKTGQVLRTLHNKGRVVVAGINMRTKHVKSSPQRAGQILKYEASIDVSNVMAIDPKDKKRSRIGYKFDDKGKKSRIAKRSGEALVATKIAKKKEEVAEEPASAKATAGKKVTKKRAKKEEPKATTEKKAKKEAVAEAPAAEKKAPFWKRMGFGAEAMEEEEGDTRASDDTSPDDKTTPSRSRASGRGS